MAVAKVKDALLLYRAFARCATCTKLQHHSYTVQLCTHQSDAGSSSPEPPTVALLFMKAKFMLYSMGRCQAVYLKNQSRKLCSAYACRQVTQ